MGRKKRRPYSSTKTNRNPTPGVRSSPAPVLLVQSVIVSESSNAVPPMAEGVPLLPLVEILRASARSWIVARRRGILSFTAEIAKRCFSSESSLLWSSYSSSDWPPSHAGHHLWRLKRLACPARAEPAHAQVSGQQQQRQGAERGEPDPVAPGCGQLGQRKNERPRDEDDKGRSTGDIDEKNGFRSHGLMAVG